jgi:hypothetical protein
MKKSVARLRKIALSIIGRAILLLRREEPAVIVMMDGGFGSTIWKYCIGRCIAKNSGQKIKYDLSWFLNCGMDMNKQFSRNFDLLKVFPRINFSVAEKREIDFYKKYFYFRNELPYRYNRIVEKCRAPVYIDGYFENWQYLEKVTPELFEWFDFSSLKLDECNNRIYNEICGHRASVCVHIRRGDYVNTGLDILGPGYYLAAMDVVNKKLGEERPKFFFFSNDMQWVEKEIVSKLGDKVEYSCITSNSNDSGFFDLSLISAGKHQIASNSSFGFLGGYFNRNPEKIVVIPSIWLSIESNLSRSTIDSEYAHRVPGFYILDYQGR